MPSCSQVIFSLDLNETKEAAKGHGQALTDIFATWSGLSHARIKLASLDFNYAKEAVLPRQLKELCDTKGTRGCVREYETSHAYPESRVGQDATSQAGLEALRHLGRVEKHERRVHRRSMKGGPVTQKAAAAGAEIKVLICEGEMRDHSTLDHGRDWRREQILLWTGVWWPFPVEGVRKIARSE